MLTAIPWWKLVNKHGPLLNVCVVHVSLAGEVDPTADDVKAADHAEIHAENMTTHVMCCFKEFASKFKSVVVALKDKYCLQCA